MNGTEFVTGILLQILSGRSNDGGRDGWGMFLAWEKRERHTEFWLEYLGGSMEEDERINLN
jgi:hypothetical protein